MRSVLCPHSWVNFLTQCCRWTTPRRSSLRLVGFGCFNEKLLSGHTSDETWKSIYWWSKKVGAFAQQQHWVRFGCLQCWPILGCAVGLIATWREIPTYGLKGHPYSLGFNLFAWFPGHLPGVDQLLKGVPSESCVMEPPKVWRIRAGIETRPPKMSGSKLNLLGLCVFVVSEA